MDSSLNLHVWPFILLTAARGHRGQQFSENNYYATISAEGIPAFLHFQGQKIKGNLHQSFKRSLKNNKAEICVPFRPKFHLLFLAKSKGWGDICTKLLPIWIPASKLSKGKCYLCFLLLPWKCEFVFPCCLFSGNMSICSRRVIQCIKVTSW